MAGPGWGDSEVSGALTTRDPTLLRLSNRGWYFPPSFSWTASTEVLLLTERVPAPFPAQAYKYRPYQDVFENFPQKKYY